VVKVMLMVFGILFIMERVLGLLGLVIKEKLKKVWKLEK